MVQVESVQTGHVLNGLPRYPVAIKKEEYLEMNVRFIESLDLPDGHLGL